MSIKTRLHIPNGIKIVKTSVDMHLWCYIYSCID